jgi:hypothetical protein
MFVGPLTLYVPAIVHGPPLKFTVPAPVTVALAVNVCIELKFNVAPDATA